MKKKISKILASMLIITLALTGCMTTTSETKINTDGVGTVVTTVDIEKAKMDEFLNSMGETDPAAMFEGQTYSVVSIDGTDYYRVSDTSSYTKDELSKGLTETMGQDVYATTDTIYTEYTTDSEDTDAIALYAAMGVDVSGIKATYTFEFPAPIVSTTGTIDEANPNKVSFTMDMSTKNLTLFATTKAGTTVDTVKATVKKLNTVKSTKIRKLKTKKTKTKKAKATLKIKRVKGAKYYEVEYSRNKKFKASKTTYKTIKKTTTTIKNLKRGKKYYFRVRVVKENYAGTEIYSKWVKKTLKVKKLKK